VAAQFAYEYPTASSAWCCVHGRRLAHGQPAAPAGRRPGRGSHDAGAERRTDAGGGRAVGEVLRFFGSGLGIDLEEILRVFGSLPDAESRQAIVRTLRASIDWHGQVITMLDRAYLVKDVPTLLIWGSKDAIIPVGHGYDAHRAMPGSRLEVFEDAAHFPHHTDPARSSACSATSSPPPTRSTTHRRSGATSCAPVGPSPRPPPSEVDGAPALLAESGQRTPGIVERLGQPVDGVTDVGVPQQPEASPSRPWATSPARPSVDADTDRAFWAASTTPPFPAPWRAPRRGAGGGVPAPGGR